MSPRIERGQAKQEKTGLDAPSVANLERMSLNHSEGVSVAANMNGQSRHENGIQE